MAATDLSFCKCRCFSNYTIIPLYRPKVRSVLRDCELTRAGPVQALLDLHEARRAASQPSSSSTRQFCLDQQLPICQDASKGEANQDTGTGDEGDVQAKCFRTCARCRLVTDAV